ncbi:lipopolysaccharide assembly protein LapB [Niveibacterium terrae]|uniref:lipopolysaccharide assembly protein LapB n=1 Tax=Niveibacterium terrae TaxID=3373598 RepID=UPI003A955BC3
MEFELWWLIVLPLAFGLGWITARIDIRHLVRESRALPRSYLSGLNFLLNEEPDKAIDSFLEAARIDPQTVELHFALGSLFRRRGELDRAIRMHQTLVDRDDLSAEQRANALSELGQDYLKAGLLDRAEAAFVALKETGLREFALKQLLEIYQQEKDWAKAIEVASLLPTAGSVVTLKEIANFHCEIGASELALGHLDEAEAQLIQALETNRQCVRANILLGDVKLVQGDVAGALAAWQKIEQQNPIYLAQVAERLMEGFGRLGEQAQGLTLLRSYLERYPSLDLLDAVFQWELEREGAQAAYELVREELRRNPTVLGLDKLLEAALLTADIERRQEIELVKGLIHNHTRRVARYRCEECGFKARQFYWRCPACGGWETYPPRRTEEFDLTP